MLTQKHLGPRRDDMHEPFGMLHLTLQIEQGPFPTVLVPGNQLFLAIDQLLILRVVVIQVRQPDLQPDQLAAWVAVLLQVIRQYLKQRPVFRVKFAALEQSSLGIVHQLPRSGVDEILLAKQELCNLRLSAPLCLAGRLHRFLGGRPRNPGVVPWYFTFVV